MMLKKAYKNCYYYFIVKGNIVLVNRKVEGDFNSNSLVFLYDENFNLMNQDEIEFEYSRPLILGKKFGLFCKHFFYEFDLETKRRTNHTYENFKCLSSINEYEGLVIRADIDGFSQTYDRISTKRLYLFDAFLWEKSVYGLISVFSSSIVLHFSEHIFESEKYSNSFSKLSFESGQKEWDFSLRQYQDRIVSAYPFDHPLHINKPLGIYKDQLWFSMSNYGLLCLQNSTGKFLHYFRDCPENNHGVIYLPYGGYPVLPFTENSVLLEEEGKIICFDSMYYWEMDLETFQLTYHFLEEYLKASDCYTYGHRFKPLVVDGENIYIVSNLTRKFGCFNRKTLEYNWVEALPNNSGAPRSIEKHGSRLYIDTDKKELLIYEL